MPANEIEFTTPRDDTLEEVPFGDEAGAQDAQAVVDELDSLAEPGDSLVVGPLDPHTSERRLGLAFKNC